ncbi:MAG: hypothetical protein ACRD4B_07055, partial [Acidobacteriota bacterium]
HDDAKEKPDDYTDEQQAPVVERAPAEDWIDENRCEEQQKGYADSNPADPLHALLFCACHDYLKEHLWLLP